MVYFLLAGYFLLCGVCGVTLVLRSRSTTPGETKLLASEIYELLQASGGAESEPAAGAVGGGRRKAQFFLGSSNKRAKTVILHIDGLDDSVSRKPRWRRHSLRVRSEASGCGRDETLC